MISDYDKPILNKDNKPLKILMVGAHFCIRVVKRAKALMSKGYEVHGLGEKMSYGVEFFKTFTIYQNENQCKEAIRLYINSGIDIIDYSNEPSHPAIWAREVINSMNMQDKVKLVVDLHDLDTIRQGFAPVDELKMINAADALIYVSLPIQERCNKLFNINKSTIVLYSYCNKDIVTYDDLKIFDRKHLVYEGGLNPPDDEQMNRSFAYRDLYGIMKKLVEMGNETHIYCGNASAYATYQNTGTILHPPTIYNEMMQELTKYKYNLCIFNNEDGKKEQVNLTLANKLFEGAAAGMPTLACWCPEIEKVVDKWGIGFTFKHIEEIGDCSQLEDKYIEKMRNIKEFNSKVYMENFIIKNENLYAKLLGLEKKVLPENIKKLHLFEYGEEEMSNTL